ncbi:PaaI family thioesterase [Sphingomonas sp. ID1715]|uniref:PaaI family thioesterase n=1 Tax=Sphingomonas sp. ID1715 TaxID=1656898 RepID=UPI001489E7B8|nr:PaaI family thioesterase [Sphingomonas sp. ID1715]NNM78210.1 PaaI family thioesterase [Sphingomonas sp. ID1715]
MKLPPYAGLLGLTITGEEAGAPILTMPWRTGVMGRPGFLHGGAIGGLLEMAAIAALHARFADDERPRIKPITVTVDYMRGGREAETFALGRITRLGTRVANLEASAWQEDRDRPIALARMNVLLSRS